MRVDTLPSPGLLAQGIQIRTLMAKAISAIEINGGLSVNGGKSTMAKPFSDFLDAAKAAIATFVDAVVPTVIGRSINADDATHVMIYCSEGLDPKFVPPISAFTIAGTAKTIDRVRVEGNFIRLRVTVPFAAGNTVTVAYTQPGATANARDLSGNLLASFTAAAVTNSLV